MLSCAGAGGRRCSHGPSMLQRRRRPVRDTCIHWISSARPVRPTEAGSWGTGEDPMRTGSRECGCGMEDAALFSQGKDMHSIHASGLEELNWDPKTASQTAFGSTQLNCWDRGLKKKRTSASRGGGVPHMGWRLPRMAVTILSLFLGVL